jgi:hypothetical protein
VSFEERPADIVDNVASLGFGLDEPVANGKILITRSLSYSAEGVAELTFDPAGVRCPIRIPPRTSSTDAAAAAGRRPLLPSAEAASLSVVLRRSSSSGTRDPEKRVKG